MIHSSFYDKLILFIVLVLCCIYVCFAQNVVGTNLGSICEVTINVTGTCKLVQDCPRAVIQKELNKSLQYCGEEKKLNPVVCCPNVGDISKQKCIEYGKEILKIKKSLYYRSRMLTPLRRRPKRSLIVNEGQDANPGEFAHMALLGYGKEERRFWVCGGSLISHHYVLTAAHCSYHKQSESTVKWVRLGEYNQSDEFNINRVDFNVKEFIKHPLYNPKNKYYDIALILLDQKVTISIISIRPACLNTIQNVDKEMKFIATGWGSLGDREELASVLQKVELNQFSKNECQESYNDTGSLKSLPNGITDSLICAGDKTGGKDTCGGDSGGPLQISHEKVDNMLSIVGITAFGKKNCGQAGIPGVYTKVSNYIEWIENIVWI